MERVHELAQKVVIEAEIEYVKKLNADREQAVEKDDPEAVSKANYKLGVEIKRLKENGHFDEEEWMIGNLNANRGRNSKNGKKRG